MNNFRPGANVVSWWLGRKPDAVLYSWLGKKKMTASIVNFGRLSEPNCLFYKWIFFVVRHDVFLAFGLVQHILSGRI